MPQQLFRKRDYQEFQDCTKEEMRETETYGRQLFWPPPPLPRAIIWLKGVKG